MMFSVSRNAARRNLIKKMRMTKLKQDILILRHQTFLYPILSNRSSLPHGTTEFSSSHV